MFSEENQQGQFKEQNQNTAGSGSQAVKKVLELALAS